jgi:hypothetical protein
MSKKDRIHSKITQANEELIKLRSPVRLDSKTDNRYSKSVSTAVDQLKSLEEIEIENPSLLVKYRQNITVPVQWVPVQGIRAENIGMIPAENIIDLDRYITDSVTRIDGGDLDV